MVGVYYKATRMKYANSAVAAYERIPMPRLLTSLTFISTLLLSSAFAGAATIYVNLSKEKAVDPETGVTQMVPLNPSGTAELTFLATGLQFEYQDASNKTQKLKVYFEYLNNEIQIPPDSSGDLLRMTLQRVQDYGISLIGQIMKQGLKAPNQTILYFNQRGKPGYINADFDSQMVEMHQSGPQGVTKDNLKNFLFETVLQGQISVMNFAAQAKAKAQAQALGSATPTGPNPIGFIWDSAESTPTQKIKCQIALTSH
jgi:hypothetical protein